MADKAAKKQGAEGDGEAAGKKGGKRKLIVGVICVALAGGAYVVGSKSAAAPASGEPATTTTVALIDGCVKEPEPGQPEKVVDLPEMSINLADGHYLRVAASLGVCADVVIPEGGELPTAPARDVIIATLSGKQMSELATEEGRAAAKEALSTAISGAYRRGVVYRVYLSQFVMQ